jgi:hypothetical protein
LLVALACAGTPREAAGPSVLLSEPAAPEEPAETVTAPTGPLALPFRGPGPGGTAYQLLLEFSGERTLSLSSDLAERQPLHESHLLELEYRELPVETRGDTEPAYLLTLDGLHYRLLQKNPTAEREIELGDDRLRITSNGKTSLDLRGSQPKEDLTPRKLLGRVFGIVLHDPVGNPLRIQPRGVPPARRFLDGLMVGDAIAYSRLPLADHEIAVGARWRAERYPASPAGDLGLRLPIDYELAGFRELDGVLCAWILFRSEQDAEDVPSSAGFRFDRVSASLTGEAWVELATSRVRRLVLEDEIRVSYTRGGDPEPSMNHRLRHVSRLLLTLRDPDAKPEKWEDGSDRFGRR